MRTIKELNEVVSLGEYAQDELNSIAESIYEFYLSEIERQKKEFQKEFPMFDDRITDLGSGRCSFYKYNIYGGELQLSDEERFRGETNTEYDTLPSTVFIDDKEEREIIIKDFVKSKFDQYRVRMIRDQNDEDERTRKLYESLKNKYEGNK